MNITSIKYMAALFAVVAGLSLLGLSKNHNIRRSRRLFLLAANYVFYAAWDKRFCLLMFVITAVAYLSAKGVENPKYRKLSMFTGAGVPVAVLLFFKYTNFFLASFSRAFGIKDLASLNIILPVGISFYTFLAVSYTADVYRGKSSSAGFIDVAAYISFFPLQGAGPIVRAGDFIPQFKANSNITLADIETGVQIFLMGMFRKIVLADRLSVFVNDVFSKPGAFSSFTVLLGVIAYALQIYFDFSGYSDMAIGSAKCLGYDLKQNFNLPYLSKNPTEFWKRWHISLSSWLQEYLYIPLGGNRKGKTRTYINLMLTMLIGGLWHGANRTFILWGALNGLGLCLHKIYRKKYSAKLPVHPVIAMVMNNIFVCVCWVFFRADSFDKAVRIFKKILMPSGGIQQIYAWLVFAVVVEAMYIFICTVKSKSVTAPSKTATVNAVYFHHNLNTVKGLFLFFLEIMAVIGLAYTGGSPFIYFRF